MFRIGARLSYIPDLADRDIVNPAVVVEICDNPDVYMILYTDFVGRRITTCVGSDQLEYMAKRQRGG
jgi:hypothetical protein